MKGIVFVDNEVYAIYEFPFGKLKIGYNDAEIIYINKTDEQGIGAPSALSDLAAAQLSEYFDGKRKEFNLPLQMQGTEFQRKIWSALKEIPYGETCSYKDLAIKIGSPKAVRAVGGANHNNPFIIVVPCHRVIGASGKLVGYGGGLEMKQLLLELERKHR